ncbi:MFS transporter [Limosilactobacillus sp. WILCCON 0053]|uniref:MFS transporter n=1 Tax=Limosilactobacillus allomucosae TaxID=3142938 RepID=UPI0032647605
MKNRDRLVLVTVIAFGLAMRAPIVTIPLIIDQLARQLKTAVGNLGILTTIPLIMFLLFSIVVAKEMTRFGLRRALNFGLTALVLGALLRLDVAWPMLLLGTVLVGLGITHLNVLTPSVVATYEPNQTALYTTAYSMAIMVGSAVFSLLTHPLSTAFGWWSVLVALLLLTMFPWLMWLAFRLPMPKRPQPERTIDQSDMLIDEPKLNSPAAPLWKNRYAWCCLLMFGAQSIINYTLVAWLPELMRFNGISGGQISIVLAMYSFAGMPVSLLLPRFLETATHRSQIIMSIVVGLLTLLAAVLMFWQSAMPLFYWYYLAIITGAMTAFYFIMALTMFPLKTISPARTAQLSGLTQSGGYLIAALGPSLYGLAFKCSPLGTVQIWAFAIIVVLCTLASFVVVKMPKI